MRRKLAVLALVAAALGATPTVAAARPPRVLTQDLPHPWRVRPATIDYTGDGTALVGGRDGTSVRHPGHLRWSRYTHRVGIARGTVWLDDCEPSCAEGTYHPARVKVRVFDLRRDRFRRLTLRYRYRGHRVVDRRKVRHQSAGNGAGGFWLYDIV